MILVGLPGSGKSYFSSKLAENYPTRIIVINQDTLGSQTECEKLLMSTIKSDKSARCIIDKCNVTIESRKHWSTYSMIDRSHIVLIWFDYSTDQCISRVLDRVGHPTIEFGSEKAGSIIRSFSNRFESPTESEGFKKIVRLTSFHMVNDFLETMGCDPSTLDLNTGIIKFPRTHHIFDASTDDKSAVT
jgi:atypical dual specificity phosphatase